VFLVQDIKVEIIEADKYYGKFKVSGINPAIANAFRRALLAEVPTMAVDEVVILENTSALFDETLAHRIGLIPLKTDFDLVEEYIEDRENAIKKTVSLILEIEALDENVTVFSGHLKSEDPHVVPVSDSIPIVKLAKGQRIILEAFARLGCGREHAKWQPVSVAAYKYMPMVEIIYERCDNCMKCIDVCPKDVFDLTSNKVIVKKPMNCSLCNACVEVCSTNALLVKGDETTIIFNIETTGALTFEEVVLAGFDILAMKAREFKKSVRELIKEKT